MPRARFRRQAQAHSHKSGCTFGWNMLKQHRNRKREHLQECEDALLGSRFVLAAATREHPGARSSVNGHLFCFLRVALSHSRCLLYMTARRHGCGRITRQDGMRTAFCRWRSDGESFRPDTGVMPYFATARISIRNLISDSLQQRKRKITASSGSDCLSNQ